MTSVAFYRKPILEYLTWNAALLCRIEFNWKYSANEVKYKNFNLEMIFDIICNNSTRIFTDFFEIVSEKISSKYGHKVIFLNNMQQNSSGKHLKSVFYLYDPHNAQIHGIFVKYSIFHLWDAKLSG